MRIVCDNCGAKYQIGDDKVRNKVFKIRCKKCSHTIVVRSKEGAPGAGASGETQDEATRVAPMPAGGGDSVETVAPAADAVWYIVIQREQKGPFSPSDIEGLLRKREVDAESFTWAEGMADWVRLASVTEFAHLFPAAAPAASAPVAKRAAAASMFPTDDAEDDLMVSGGPSVAAPTSSNMFGDDEPEEATRAAGPRVSANDSKLRSQRNENSVLFSLDSLGGGDNDAAPRVSNTGGSEGSGLIDISGLLGGAPKASGGGDAFGVGPVGIAPSAPSPVAGQAIPSLVARRKSNTGVVVAIIAAAVIVAGAVVFMTMRGGEKTTEGATAGGGAASGTSSQTPASVAVGSTQAPPTTPPTQAASVAATAPGGAAEAPASVAQAGGAAQQGGGGDRRPAAGPRPAGGAPRPASPGGGAEDAPPPAEAARPAVAAPADPPPKPAKKSGGEIDDLLGGLDGNPPPKKPGGNAAPAPAAANNGTDPLLPETLSKQQIMAVVKKGLPSVLTCKDRQPDASGTVMVKMKIEGSGGVSSAEAQGGFSGSPVGKCIESTVRTFRFPQFSGDSMSVNMPFAL
jgi:predicted Zn finger-like uncharacterized protein